MSKNATIPKHLLGGSQEFVAAGMAVCDCHARSNKKTRVAKGGEESNSSAI